MAASNHTITFQDGSSTAPVMLPVGTYSFVSTTIPGYADGGVAQFTVTPTTTSLALSITANGTLEVTVEDDLGTLITSGALQLSDQTGAARYGVETDIVDGEASFPNVPYVDTGIEFYIAQDSSDENHDPIPTPQAVDMTQQVQTETLINARKSIELDFTMEDANYAGITPLTGDLVMNG